MKILMVCLGNICRSPLAEGIMRDKIQREGIDVTVDSAGTADYHTGEPPDKRSQEVAQKHGIDISKQRARTFQIADFDRFDRIYVMDRNNYNDLAVLARDKQDMQKLDLILNTLHPGKNKEVPDPYYGGINGFENVYQMLDASCNKVLQTVLTNNDETA
ncbi:MAG: low molecular weight protein-tyrosine-phosphatase [Bacteroidales bacterium]